MAKKPHDDLFEGTTMTFGEHLEELRRSLFRAIIGIVVGCVIGFLIANEVVRFFQTPLERAMERYYTDKAVTDFDALHGGIPVEQKRMILDQGLIPEYIEIDTGALAETLRLTYPERFAALEISPYWATEGDFKPGGVQLFCRQIVAAANDSASAQSRVWKLLTPEQREAAKKLSTASDPLTRQQTAQALGLLNDLLAKRELHDSAEFAAVQGPDSDPTSSLQSKLGWLFGIQGTKATDTVVELRAKVKDKTDPEATRRLNKLLLARVFPDALHKARLNLLTLTSWRPVKVRFQVLNAQEAFMIWLKAALMTGLVIASPWIFYQVWVFVAAGLYPHEKNYVYLYLPISILLFFGGASLAFGFVFDPVLDFLFLFNKGMNADFDPRIGEWLSFVLILPIGFGLSFQLPLVMLFVNRIGLVSVETYIAQWRVAILTIFIVAMILTPADPISMLLMAGPLCFLYLLGILMCKYMPRGRNPFAEAYEP